VHFALRGALLGAALSAQAPSARGTHAVHAVCRNLVVVVAVVSMVVASILLLLLLLLRMPLLHLLLLLRQLCLLRLEGLLRLLQLLWRWCRHLLVQGVINGRPPLLVHSAPGREGQQQRQHLLAPRARCHVQGSVPSVIARPGVLASSQQLSNLPLIPVRCSHLQRSAAIGLSGLHQGPGPGNSLGSSGRGSSCCPGCSCRCLCCRLGCSCCGGSLCSQSLCIGHCCRPTKGRLRCASKRLPRGGAAATTTLQRARKDSAAAGLPCTSSMRW
jgi:hypothetical protein